MACYCGVVWGEIEVAVYGGSVSKSSAAGSVAQMLQ